MKPIVLVLLVAAFLFAGLLGAGLLLWFGPAEIHGAQGSAPAFADPRPAPQSGEHRSSEIESLRAELAMLRGHVDELESEMARLKGDAGRRPVEPAPERAATSPLPADGAATFTPQDRQVVLDVLASVREEEQQRREQERLERDEQWGTDRAAEIAKELGLSLADQHTLADHLVAASQKRNELMDQARQDGFDPAAMRDGFLALRDWNDEQLDVLFGPETSDQIQRYERERRDAPGFGGFFRGGDRGDRGGPGGRPIPPPQPPGGG